MEELFRVYASYIALGLEIVAVVVIAFGGIQAAVRLLLPARDDPARPYARKKAVWVQLGVWLMLGLEFELGADIIRSAISPTWEMLGQLAAIALIRTFLNYFLEKDIEKYAESLNGEE
jgi:uncharacterized membrane protein